jgi:hypothetical protein
MCGSFTQSCTWRELAAPYRLTLWVRNMQPRYNIAPTPTANAVQWYCLSFKFDAIDLLSAKHHVLFMSRFGEALRHIAAFSRDGSQPRYRPGHLPGLSICEVHDGANFSAPASGGREANIAGLGHAGDAWQDKSYGEIVQFGRGAGRGILDEH